MNKPRRRKLSQAFAAVLAVITLLTALTVPVFAEPEDTTGPAATAAPVSETATPVTDPPVTEPPATEPPVTQPPETTPPTEPPATEPVTEPPADPQPETESTQEPEPEPRSMFRFSPDGSLTLVDDFLYDGLDADGNLLSKQFITVQSRDGSYFYIIIDRTGDSENVYFLNQVDLADLKSLANNEAQTIPDTSCTCTSHCTVGHIDTSCPVCAINMSDCAVIEDKNTPSEPADDPAATEPAQEGEPDDPEAAPKKQSMNPILALVLTVIVLGGIGFYLLKGKGKGLKTGSKRKKPDFDFDEDEDEDDEELSAEPASEPEPDAASSEPKPEPDDDQDEAADDPYAETGEDDDLEDDEDLM